MCAGNAESFLCSFGYAMLKTKLSLIFFTALLCLPAALYYARFYATGYGEATLFIQGSFYVAALCHAQCYFLLGALLFILLPQLPWELSWSRAQLIWRATVVFLLLLALAVDAHVFLLYRFHISWAMLDLFFNAGNEVISFSAGTWRSIALEAAVLLLYAVIVALAATALSLFKVKLRFMLLVWLLGLLYCNVLSIVGNARAITPLMEFNYRLPLYHPLTMNGQLSRWGLLSEDELARRGVRMKTGGLFSYPRHPLTYAPVQTEPYNVLLLVVDALRADMLTPEIMPHTWAYAQEHQRFTEHFSAGNATRAGIFTLFYGIPPSYWNVARSSGTQAALVSAALSRGYRLGTFTAATLTRPEFNETVFAGVTGLRMGSRGNNALERDQDAIADFKTFAAENTDKPFFAFVFLDAVHSSERDPQGPLPFAPEPPDLNYLALDESSDPAPYLNLYKNSAYQMDARIHELLLHLEEQGLLSRTVVIITADHGQEFNDNGLNFWGHNGNFTAAQLKVPLVVAWPGRGAGVQSERSVSYDVSTTLMEDLFSVQNQPSDYTVGQNLFALKPRNFFLAGDYLQNAVVQKDRIVVIDEMGLLRFKDPSYHDSSETRRTPELMEALLQMKEFMSGE